MPQNSNRKLEPLLGRIDDWFKDLELERPICQFSLEEINSPNKKPNFSDENNDHARLASIATITEIWFKPLTDEPQITKHGIEDETEDESEAENEVDRHSQNQHTNLTEDDHLEMLAKDLEQLLDDDDRFKSPAKTPRRRQQRTNKKKNSNNNNNSVTGNHENQDEAINSEKQQDNSFYFPIYTDDENALLDEMIGNSCTIENTKRASKRRRLAARDFDQFSSSLNMSLGTGHQQQQQITSSQVGSDSTISRTSDQQSRERKHLSPSRLTLKQHTDFKRHHYKDDECSTGIHPSVTPMPRDHDYLKLSEARNPSFLSSNRAQRMRDLRERKDKCSSILNTRVIERFARFSDRFKVLSLKHESQVRMLAIKNS